jgi:NTE family protein
MKPSSTRLPYQDQLLERHLVALLGDIGPQVLALLRQHLEWLDIAGGETLMEQGDVGDSMYLAVSGRLRVYVSDEEGHSHMVREIARGQIVGELSLYTDEPRTATVLAIRDSVLVRLPKAAFSDMLASSAQVSIALTRQIIKRLQGDQRQPALEKPVMIGLMPITADIDLPDFAARLAGELAPIGRVCIVDAALVDRELAAAGIATSEAGNAEHNRRIALLLDAIEADHDYVLLLGNSTPDGWTQRCCAHSDELLLLADAARAPGLHATEEQLLMRRPARTGAAEILVLLHAAEQRLPRDTAAWLARRPVAGHIHLRPVLARDMARLARLQSRTAVGLVLAGGGARGFAHLGILKALQEQGVEVDCVGGTSIGAVMAVYAASDQPLDAVMANARQAFSINPIGDFNWLPLLSLFKGKRLRRILARAAQDLFGFDANLEDLWKSCYCIATNYSKASELTLTHGNIVDSLLASISIPGALPPVIRDNDLLCDGGTFNNFPVDVMRTMRGMGTVIGVDLSFRNPRRITHAQMPGTWALLRDRLRPRAKRHYRLPSLPAYLMNVTVLYSTSRQRSAQRMTDIYFNPPLMGVGMLQWHKFDQIVRQGHAHGLAVLGKLDAAPP